MNETIKKEMRGGNEVTACTDCGRWEYLGQAIRHSSRCDNPKTQWVEEANNQTATSQSVNLPCNNVHPRMDANGKPSSELLEGVQKGYLSMSDAMNTDF